MEEIRNGTAYITTDEETKGGMPHCKYKFDEQTNQQLSDIVGHEKEIEFLKEKVVLPMRFPQLFQNNYPVWNGTLLCGPKGSGKSTIVKAIKNMCENTETVSFFNFNCKDFEDPDTENWKNAD